MQGFEAQDPVVFMGSRINVILPNVLFSICSMTVNFACTEKSWCAERKCCSTGSNLSESVDLILCL